jgi:hypothetical protein
MQGAKRHDVLRLPARRDDAIAEAPPSASAMPVATHSTLQPAASNGPCRRRLGAPAMPRAISASAPATALWTACVRGAAWSQRPTAMLPCGGGGKSSAPLPRRAPTAASTTGSPFGRSAAPAPGGARSGTAWGRSLSPSLAASAARATRKTAMALRPSAQRCSRRATSASTRTCKSWSAAPPPTSAAPAAKIAALQQRQRR